jgi:hypothetical protein
MGRQNGDRCGTSGLVSQGTRPGEGRSPRRGSPAVEASLGAGVPNPKPEIRSPKQIRSARQRMTKTTAHRRVSSIGPLGFWGCFGLRPSLGFRPSGFGSWAYQTSGINSKCLRRYWSRPRTPLDHSAVARLPQACGKPVVGPLQARCTGIAQALLSLLALFYLISSSYLPLVLLSFRLPVWRTMHPPIPHTSNLPCTDVCCTWKLHRVARQR